MVISGGVRLSTTSTKSIWLKEFSVLVAREELNVLKKMICWGEHSCLPPAQFERGIFSMWDT